MTHCFNSTIPPPPTPTPTPAKTSLLHDLHTNGDGKALLLEEYDIKSMPYSTFLLLSFLVFHNSLDALLHVFKCSLWGFSSHRVQVLKCKSELVEAGGPAYKSSMHMTQREWQHIQTCLLPVCYVMLVWSSCYSTSSCFEITAGV